MGKVTESLTSAKVLMLVFAQVGRSIEDDTIAYNSLVSRFNTQYHTVIDEEGFPVEETNAKKAMQECIKAGTIVMLRRLVS